jgi:ankyrin repeat protein
MPSHDLQAPTAEDLCGAVSAQDENRVRELLSRGAVANGSESSVGALYIACEADPGEHKIAIARHLLKAGAKVNHLHPDKGTALMCAVNNGDEAMVALLLEHGASPQGEVRNGMTAMLLACQGGFAGIVEQLGRVGAELSKAEPYNGRAGITPLWMAADFNRAEVVGYLLTQGVDIHTRYGKNPSSALLTAVHRGYEGVVDKLLAAGANPDDCGLQGNTTCLMSSAWHGRTKLLRKLIDAGAKIDTRDDYGNTALHHACRALTGERAVSVLLSLGSDASVLNDKRQTARMVATENKLTGHIHALDAWQTQELLDAHTGGSGARKPGGRL